MSKKALAVVGGALAVVGVGWLISRAKAAVTPVQVTLMSNPIKTVLLVDGKEVETPVSLNLQPGTHRFAAIPKSQNLLVLYGFDKWTVNGRTVSYDSTVTLNLAAPATIKAEYIIAQSGRYPEIAIA